MNSTRRGSLIATVLLALAIASPAVTAQQPGALETELRRLTQENLDAIAPGDVEVLRRNLHDALIHVDENGIVRNKEEFLAEITPLPPGLEGTLTVDEFRVVQLGDTAIATHEDLERLDYHGQIIESRWRITDTWVRTSSGWRLAAEQILALQGDPPAISISTAALCAYNGTYELTTQITAVVACTDEGLSIERSDRPAAVTYAPEAPDVFFTAGQPRTRRIFQRDETGRITGFVDRREGHDIVWKKAEAPESAREP